MNPAFAYIYDECLADKRFARDLQEVENELSRKGIEGTTARASVLCEAKQLAKKFINQGVKNLIVVGSDRILSSLVPFLPETEATIGFLPIGPSVVGGLLGIPSGAKAVDVIAARLVEQVDLGQVNGRPFLLEVVAPKTIAGIDVGGAYRLRPSVRGAIAIRNLTLSSPDGPLTNPKDGELEIVIQAEASSSKHWLWSKKTLTETKVFLKEGALVAEEPFEVFIDGEVFKGQTFAFSILPKPVRLITGKRLSD